MSLTIQHQPEFVWHLAACNHSTSEPGVALLQNGKPEEKETLMSLLLNNVLKNPYIWGMALTYFFIYVVRQGVTSWFVVLPH